MIVAASSPVREAEVKTSASGFPSTFPPDLFISILGFLGKDLGLTATVSRIWKHYSIEASKAEAPNELARIQALERKLIHIKLSYTNDKVQVTKITLDPTKISDTWKKLFDFKRSIAYTWVLPPAEYTDRSSDIVVMNEFFSLRPQFEELRQSILSYWTEALEERVRKIVAVSMALIGLGYIDRVAIGIWAVAKDKAPNQKILVELAKALAQKGSFDEALWITKTIPETTKEGGINIYRIQALRYIVDALVNRARKEKVLSIKQCLVEQAYELVLTIRGKLFYDEHKLEQSIALQDVSKAFVYLALATKQAKQRVFFFHQAFDIAKTIPKKYHRELALKVISEALEGISKALFDLKEVKMAIKVAQAIPTREIRRRALKKIPGATPGCCSIS